MTRPFRMLLAGALALAMLTVPAGASDATCTDPETGELVLTEQQVYLHQAETKAGNLGATDLSAYPSWDEEAPSQSVTEGAGGGYLTPYSMNSGNEAVELNVVGEFSGCLDTMLLDLYAFLPTNRTGTSGELNESTFSGYFELFVDGVPLLWGPEVEAATEPNPDGDATYRIRVAITGIHEVMHLEGIEPGSDHELQLRVSPRFANTSHALFVYDTTEVPAGILFNGEPDDSYAVLQAS